MLLREPPLWMQIGSTPNPDELWMLISAVVTDLSLTRRCSSHWLALALFFGAVSSVSICGWLPRVRQWGSAVAIRSRPGVYPPRFEWGAASMAQPKVATRSRSGRWGLVIGVETDPIFHWSASRDKLLISVCTLLVPDVFVAFWCQSIIVAKSFVFMCEGFTGSIILISRLIRSIDIV